MTSRGAAGSNEGLLLEAEDFDDYGGWVLETQYVLEMGYPYLMAHGLGVPVADAVTTLTLPRGGSYRVWARSKDWVPSHHPGRFTVTIDEVTLPQELGAHGRDWSWQLAGQLDLAAGAATVRLRDLTGFNGRCDALYLTLEDGPPPEGADEPARAWRRQLRGLSQEPAALGTYDVVIVGGGIAGCAAALTAARLGSRVALIESRPVLGGNASVEVGLSPRGETGPIVDELAARDAAGDLRALALLRAEPTATVLLGHAVYDVLTAGSRVTAVDARDARTGREVRLSASMFIDCSGTALFGVLAAADTMFGEEARADFAESLAPEQRSELHHGHTLFFRTCESDGPVHFPDVPWAVEVAKDYADLSGQLQKPGVENGPGPKVVPPGHVPDPSVRRRMTHPLTHFWEYGQASDPYRDGEQTRDHLLRAIFGTFSNVKRLAPDTYANLKLEWVAHVPAQGEYRRYVGDHILSENDIREHRLFPDALVQNSGAFCLHYPGDGPYDFRLAHWVWDVRDEQPYDIPLRCLYSRTFDNLLMAGKHISVTRIAGSNTKFMGNGGQHGIATGATAHFCAHHETTPRSVVSSHIDVVRALIAGVLDRT